MRNPRYLVLAFILAILCLGVAPSPKPSGLPSHLPSPSPSPESQVQLMTPDASAALLKEFVKSLKTEFKAMEHRHKFELKELSASQAARRKEWQQKETEARKAFFSAHPKGTDRRGYVQDFQNRLRTLDQMLKDERKLREKEQDARLQSLKREQTDRLKEFQSFSEKNQRPPERLWPKAGN